MTPLEPGDKIIVSGEPRNPNWDRSRRGTVLAVRDDDLVDVRWDHGPYNYGLPAEDFVKVES